MPSQNREQQLLNTLWERVRPLLPPLPAQQRGGRPFADEKECFAGVVFALRNSVRWNHIPPPFPSGVTCWRRHRDRTATDDWDRGWRVVPEEVAARRKLDTSELLMDANFAEDRQGGRSTAAPAAASAFRWRSSSAAPASRSG